jgi:hypothetical protein
VHDTSGDGLDVDPARAADDRELPRKSEIQG